MVPGGFPVSYPCLLLTLLTEIVCGWPAVQCGNLIRLPCWLWGALSAHVWIDNLLFSCFEKGAFWQSYTFATCLVLCCPSSPLIHRPWTCPASIVCLCSFWGCAMKRKAWEVRLSSRIDPHESGAGILTCFEFLAAPKLGSVYMNWECDWLIDPMASKSQSTYKAERKLRDF